MGRCKILPSKNQLLLYNNYFKEMTTCIRCVSITVMAQTFQSFDKPNYKRKYKYIHQCYHSNSNDIMHFTHLNLQLSRLASRPKLGSNLMSFVFHM